MEIHGINNAMSSNICINMVKDTIVPQHLFHIFSIIFLEDILVLKNCEIEWTMTCEQVCCASYRIKN